MSLLDSLGGITLGGPDLTGGYIPAGGRQVGFADFGAAARANLTGLYSFYDLGGTWFPVSPVLGPNGPGGYLALTQGLEAKLGVDLPFATAEQVFPGFQGDTAGLGYNGPPVEDGQLAGPAATGDGGGLGGLGLAAAIAAAVVLLRRRR